MLTSAPPSRWALLFGVTCLVACSDDASTPSGVATPADTGLARDASVPPPDSLPSVVDAASDVDALASDLGPIADSAPPPDAVADATVDAAPAVPADIGPPLSASQRCFADITDPESPGPDYDQHAPVVGSHCAGTNHQDIQGVERVVFLGDSVTNGTPNDFHALCLDNDHFFRVRLANWLSERFDLDQGEPVDWEQWEAYSCLYDGNAGARNVGDFWNCAQWGADNGDFMGRINTRQVPEDEREAFCDDCCAQRVCGPDRRCIRSAASPATDDQCERPDKSLFRCVPEGVIEERTLFVFTTGGNDVAKITQRGGEFQMDTEEGRAEIEAGYPSVWRLAREAMAYFEVAIRFMKDPARFPNGSYVVVGGPFEFTDGTGRAGACQPQQIETPFGPIDLSALAINVAALAGLNEWADPRVQRDIINYMLEEYMRIAVEHEADYVWVLEHFCGHGYVAAGAEPDMSNSCYRADDPTLWFDATCTHPNDDGHAALFRLFRDVIAE